MAFLLPIEPFGQQHPHSIRGYSAVAYQQPFLSYSETHIASIPIFSVVGSLFPVPFALMQRKHNGCGSNDDFVFFFLGLSARIISLCTLFCPEFAYYIPLFIIGFAQIRYFTLKSLLGAFIGFATPFWILIGIGIMPFSGLSALIPDFTFHIPETLPFNDPQFWTIVLTALLGLFSGTTTLYTTFNEKRQTRAYNGFINLLSVYSAILLIIDYRNYTLYLPVLNMAVAMQAAFFFTNNTKKYGVVLFYLILTLYTGLFVWNLLPV